MELNNMAVVRNRRMILISRPEGLPSAANFQLVTESQDLVTAPGKVLVRVEFLSIDPAMRVWISDKKSYFETVKIGGMMPSLGVGVVVRSGAEGFKEGDLVRGLLGWQEYALCAAADLHKVPKHLSPTLHLGLLGINGLSAYVALVTIADVQAKETVLISTAAGAVGSVAVQIAKIKGCRVVGIAGTDEKCRWVMEELGADACINYNKAKNMNEAIKKYCPEGVDVYLDNVGGETLAAVLNRMNNNGRIAMCGAIQSYNTKTAPPLVNYPCFPRRNIISKNIKVQGFIVMNHAKEFKTALGHLKTWLQTGKIKAKEHIIEGLENCPEALQMLFTGRNTGKVIVKVQREPRL